MTALVSERRSEQRPDGTMLTRVVLTEAGLDALYRQGWTALQESLGMPQSWFVGADRHTARVHVDDSEPHVVTQRRQAAALSVLLYVAPDLRWFGGHFPGRPLLPGVVQIGWAAALAARTGLAKGDFNGLSRVRFVAPVEPGDVVWLTIEGSGTRLPFSIDSAAGIRSRGTLRYRD